MRTKIRDSLKKLFFTWEGNMQRKLSDHECGERLRERRKECGLTQAQLADKIDELDEEMQVDSTNKNRRPRSEKQISYLENGSRPISYDYAWLLSGILKVRYEWLMGYDDYKTEEDYETATRERIIKEEKCTIQAKNKMYKSIERKFSMWFGEEQREQLVRKVLENFDLELYVNQEGLEGLACYKRLMENTVVENIHTLDFLDIIMQHNETGDEREGYKEYMNFSRERATTDHAYILLHKTNGGRAYMSEEEKNRFVDEICSHIEYFEYKIHRLFEKENLREETNG